MLNNILECKTCHILCNRNINADIDMFDILLSIYGNNGRPDVFQREIVIFNMISSFLRLLIQLQLCFFFNTKKFTSFSMPSSLDALPTIVQNDIDCKEKAIAQVWVTANCRCLVFGPATLTVEQAVVIAHATSVQSNNQRTSTNKQIHATSSLDTQKIYCSACKKSFATDATWQTHLRSAKHINMIKAQRPPSSVAQKQQQQQQKSGKSYQSIYIYIENNHIN
jgi:hypothetical protein